MEELFKLIKIGFLYFSFSKCAYIYIYVWCELGGVLNRSVEVEFPLTGDHVAIKQYFSGLDAFGYLDQKTDITGTTPAIAEGTKINMGDYDVQYTRVKPGEQSRQIPY